MTDKYDAKIQRVEIDGKLTELRIVLPMGNTLTGFLPEHGEYVQRLVSAFNQADAETREGAQVKNAVIDILRRSLDLISLLRGSYHLIDLGAADNLALDIAEYLKKECNT